MNASEGMGGRCLAADCCRSLHRSRFAILSDANLTLWSVGADQEACSAHSRGRTLMMESALAQPKQTLAN
jgi:hypothetical protein